MKPKRLSEWSQRMVVAECLAVSMLSIGEAELDVDQEQFTEAFGSAWKDWPLAGYYPAVDPDRIVALLSGPRSVSDAIAHWRDRQPFRPSLTSPGTPADLNPLISSYTGITLEQWEQLASSLAEAARRPRE